MRIVFVVLLFAGSSLFAADPPAFEKDVLPILEAKCAKCHGARQRSGRLDIRTKDDMLKGGGSGPAFVSGDSAKSLMVDMMFYNEMPPKREKNKVTKDELEVIKKWIDAGAPVKK
jgi:uncharacterized membrane protein